jgi:hypothetical protein
MSYEHGRLLGKSGTSPRIGRRVRERACNMILAAARSFALVLSMSSNTPAVSLDTKSEILDLLRNPQSLPREQAAYMTFHDGTGANCPRLAGAVRMTEWGGVTIRVPTFWWQETNVSVEWPKSREAANIVLSNDVCRYRLNFTRFSGRAPDDKWIQLRDLNELNAAINEIVVEHLRAQDPSRERSQGW